MSNPASPNFLSSDNQLASSHADALRGVLDFLLTAPFLRAIASNWLKTLSDCLN